MFYELLTFELRRICSIRHYLSVQATETLVSTLVLSRLDYCNFLLSGCLVNRLQKCKNNTARLILQAPKTHHITPHLCTLHWLPIDARIKYKMCSFYLLSFILVLATFLLCSRYIRPLGNFDPPQTTVYLYIPSVNTKSYGERSFSFIAPTL